MQYPTTPEWSKPPHPGEWPRKTSIDSATSFLSPPPFGDFPRKKSIDSATSFLSPPPFGDFPRKKSIDSATSLNPPLWGEAITNKFHINSNGKSFSASPFGSCDNISEQEYLQHQQHQKNRLRLDLLLPTNNKARKVRSDEQAVPKDKYDRLKLKSGSAFAQSSALLNSASVTHLDSNTDENELQLRYDRLKVRRARIQQKVHSGTSYSSTSSIFSICSEGSACNFSYSPEHPRQGERGREGHRTPTLAPPSQSHLTGAQGPCINNAFPYTEQVKTVVHTTPSEFNNDLRVIVTPPQPHLSQATPRGGRERSRPRSPKMGVSASTSNISVLLQAQEGMKKVSSGSQPLLLGEVLESDHTKTPAVPFILPPIQMHCDQSGGVYTVGDHDIQLKVPHGAIKKRATVDIQIGVCLHGPFAFPPNTQLVSPVIWLHVNSDVKLAKPVEITIPHCLEVRATEGTSTTKMQFLRASCKPRVTARGQTHKYQFSELDSKGVSKWEESSGTLATKQSSFLCVAVNNTPAIVSQIIYCLIMALPRPINSSTWKIQCCITYFLKTCIQAVKRQFADQHEVLPLQKFHFTGSSTHAALSVDFERSIGGTGWLLALESSPKISPSDVNFMDPTSLMESLNLYPPRFTIRVHGEEAKCTTIAHLAFKGCRETINMETILPLRRQGCQVLSPQTSTHCASCSCHEATAASSNGERDFLALNYGHGKLADSQHHQRAALHSTPNPSCETALVPPTDKELERVADEIVRRLGSGWLKLHTYLNVKEYQQDGDLQLKEPATYIQLLDMLKKWRSTSQECTKTQLAACLKNTDRQLQEVANWLVHGQLLEQE